MQYLQVVLRKLVLEASIRTHLEHCLVFGVNQQLNFLSLAYVTSKYRSGYAALCAKMLRNVILDMRD